MPVIPLWNVIYLSVGAPYLSGITQNYDFGSLCCFPFLIDQDNFKKPDVKTVGNLKGK